MPPFALQTQTFQKDEKIKGDKEKRKKTGPSWLPSHADTNLPKVVTRTCNDRKRKEKKEEHKTGSNRVLTSAL